MAYLAPAGTPVTLRDIAHGIASAMTGTSGTAALVAALRTISGLPQAWPVSSGRAAMTTVLRAMRAACGDPDRIEVIIPAYTCYSVPAAIERAGLLPRLCDIEPSTLGMDPDRLARCDFSRVLAVVSANLYGLPNELAAIESICRNCGVYFLDDAAQALGASVSNRPVGTFGDAGIFSFDKGKIISTFQGGAVVSRSDRLAVHLERAVAKLAQPDLAESVGNILKLAFYSVFLRPALYPLVRAIPFTGLGHTVYEPRYPVSRLSKMSSYIATRLLGRLEEFASVRQRNAAGLQQALEGLDSVELIRSVPGSVAAFARYPLRIRDPAVRPALIDALDRAGIGATVSYPLALADVPQVRAKVPAADTNCPGARRIATTIVTLPTHAYCPANLPDRVLEVISACTT